MNTSRVFGTAVITGMILLTAGAGYLAINSRNSRQDMRAQEMVYLASETDLEEDQETEASAEESSILVPAGVLIEDVLVEKGDEVQAGQILAVVDRSSAAAALEEALAQKEPDEDLVAALRELAETQTIIAPEDGRIEQVLVAEGETTSAGQRNKERRSSEVRTTTASETDAEGDASMEETASAEETVSTEETAVTDDVTTDYAAAEAAAVVAVAENSVAEDVLAEESSAEAAPEAEASDSTPITGLQIRKLLAAALPADDGSEESAVATEQADPFQILITDTDGKEILGLPADTESRVTEVLIGLVAEEGYFFTEDSVEDDGTADETLIPSGSLQWRITAWEATCDEDGSRLVVRLEMTAGEESTDETPAEETTSESTTEETTAIETTTEATTLEASTAATTAPEASSTETTKKSSKSSKTGKKSGTGRSSGSSKRSGAGRSARSGRTSDSADGTDSVDSTDSADGNDSAGTANSTGESSKEAAGRGGSGQGLRGEASSHVNFVEAFTYTTSL